MSWYSWRKTHRWLGVAAGCLLGAASAFADDPKPTPRQTTELYGGAPLAKPADEKVLQAADKAVNGPVLSGAVPAQATSPADMPTLSTSQANDAADYVYPNQGQFFYANNRLMRRQPQPGESEQPLAPVETPQSQVIPVSSIAGDLDFNFSNINEGARIDMPSPIAAEGVTGGTQPLFLNTKDAGSLILDSSSSTNVSLFRRPSATDPHIRGFHQRQINTQLDGGYWMAARWDLDTIVSKIDSGVVEDVIVIKGPYSAIYGPGFSFIDVVTVPTPRFCCPDYRARTIMNWQDNNNGFYGREIIEGGGSNWGFRINTGFRTANDYTSGNGTLIRGSFKHRDIDFALGYDMTPDDRLEFNYVRLDLTDAEFYNQPTDIDWLVTNGFSARYESDYGVMYDHYVAEGWYNRTRLAQSGGTPLYDPIDGNFGLLVNTYADQISYGTRGAITWGDEGCSHVTLGSDYRVLEQELLELDTFFQGNVAGMPQAFDIPHSEQEDYGGFFQATDYIGPWTITTGGRIDFVDVTVDPLRNGFQLPDRNFTLWSGFATAEYELNCEWSVLVGGGHAERAPTFTELYADSPFIAGNQDGFNFYTGNPFLAKESLWQVDAGLLADYQNMQLAIRGFYGWVDNYITYVGPFVSPGSPISGYSFGNTDGVLAGADIIGDYDLGGGLSVFGNIAYSEGRDTVIGEPLYGIYPLQSRVGARLQSGNANYNGTGIEFSARIVDAQDRLATSLDERFTPGFTTYDVRGYWRANENFLLTSGVLNVFDKNYIEHFDFRVSQAEGTPSFQPGRTVYVGGEVSY